MNTKAFLRERLDRATSIDSEYGNHRGRRLLTAAALAVGLCLPGL